METSIPLKTIVRVQRGELAGLLERWQEVEAISEPSLMTFLREHRNLIEGYRKLLEWVEVLLEAKGRTAIRLERDLRKYTNKQTRALCDLNGFLTRIRQPLRKGEDPAFIAESAIQELVEAQKEQIYAVKALTEAMRRAKIKEGHRTHRYR